MPNPSGNKRFKFRLEITELVSGNGNNTVIVESESWRSFINGVEAFIRANNPNMAIRHNFLYDFQHGSKSERDYDNSHINRPRLYSALVSDYGVSKLGVLLGIQYGDKAIYKHSGISVGDLWVYAEEIV